MEFLHPITIKPEDIDQMGHVNNVIYLKWVQEAAIAHWNHIATDEMKQQNVWVVIRHEIDYLQPCFLNSKLVAKTWVGQSEGARSERFVDILDTDSNKTMAKVKTTWFLLDAKTKRPKRVTGDFINLFR
jgi:acyl-CoA thioester hydrolase